MCDKKTRVCLIGAGPAGMCFLYQCAKMKSRPEVVCYEKQSTWGGMWNFTWRTGTDEFGEPCHNGMYKYLWINDPKEVDEYPDYTYERHCGKVTPSYPPRVVHRGYHVGRAESSDVDLKSMIRFNHVVRNVSYDNSRDEFNVTVEDLQAQKTVHETFSHVVVATGIFNVPYAPDIPGLNTFPGHVFHSHDFRTAEEFRGKRVLSIGAHYSAEDVALHAKKFGAKNAVLSYNNHPLNVAWPEGIEERPLVVKVEKSKATFKDGSTGEFDIIVIATGYKYKFPFMENDLRLTSAKSLYPDNLYKGVLMTKGGNNKCFYIGVQDQYYSFTLFDPQSVWICRYIEGTLPGLTPPPSAKAMREDIDKWIRRLSEVTDNNGQVDFQTAYLSEICDVTGYDRGILKADVMYKEWLIDRKEDIARYRDKCFRSIFTGTLASKPVRPWMENYDDSYEGFVA